MLNNKGFAVSSVLYTLLIAFLLFLGAALAELSASSNLIGRANDDMVNGVSFEAMQVIPEGGCSTDTSTGAVTTKWYEKIVKNADGSETKEISNTIVRLKTRYGTMYWPKDFKNSDGSQTKINSGDDENIVNTGDGGTAISENGKIEASVQKGSGDVKLKIRFIDNTIGISAKSGNYVNCMWDTPTNPKACMGIYDLCG